MANQILNDKETNDDQMSIGDSPDSQNDGIQDDMGADGEISRRLSNSPN